MNDSSKLAAIRLHAQDAYNRASDVQHTINQIPAEYRHAETETDLYNAVVELANAKLSLELILEYTAR